MSVVATALPSPTAAELLERITDIWIPEDPDASPQAQVASAFAYVGEPETLPIAGTALAPWMAELLEVVRRDHPTHLDFRLEHEGVAFRAHRARSYHGVYLALRRLPQVTPRLADLKLPRWWHELFMLPTLCAGGLIVIAAVTGQGKSTTIGALVRSRMEKYAGHVVTLEDPVELPLHGHIGGGFCLQKNVNPDHPYEERFARGIVDAMREFPANPKGGATLVVGEVRDAETAGQLVRAANNGMLVITTVHASNARTALQRLFTLAAQTMGETVALQDLALATRLVIHQRLDFPDPGATGWQRGRLTGEVLFVAGDDAPASSIIRAGDFNKLKDVIDQQRIWLAKREPAPSFHDLLRALSGQQG